MPARRMYCDACWEPIDHRFKRCPHCRQNPSASLRLLVTTGKFAAWAAVAVLGVNLLGVPLPRPLEAPPDSSPPVVEKVVRFVTVPRLNVRLGPHEDAKIADRLQRGDEVRVHQRKQDWVRISLYYPGEIEGLGDERVARWVRVEHLSPSRPSI